MTKKTPIFFEGWRSPDGTRAKRIELVLEEFPDYAAGNMGELGKAWDRVVGHLSAAILDPVIQKNKHAVEFLEIIRSLADTVDFSETPGEIIGRFEPVFRAQQAWVNNINSQGSPEPMWWVQGEWLGRIDKDQSKASFARQYSHLVFKKFSVKITDETIKRSWLKGL